MHFNAQQGNLGMGIAVVGWAHRSYTFRPLRINQKE
jgi:hypothetical protein